jgi:glutamine synthetase
MADSDPDFVDRIRESDVRYVFVEFPDLNGVSRSKQLAADYFLDHWREGFGMQLSLLAVSPTDTFAVGAGYGEEINFADGLLRPEAGTFKRLPWRDRAARVLCRFERDGDGGPAKASTRYVLRRVLDRLDDGFDLSVGAELEFFLLDPDEAYAPVVDRNHECVTWATEAVAPFYDRLDEWAAAYGIDLQSLQQEEAPGQFEVLFEHGDPLSQADAAFDFKRVVKQTARERGLTATFMAKPLSGHPGSGCHLHVGARGGDENAFEGDDGRLSEAGLGFVGGLLAHADALCALFGPTLNGFKRQQAGYFAPTTASWGYDNRLAAVRVPGRGPVRVENRMPAADANPYLAVAATLAVGFDGVERGLDPGEPAEGAPDDAPPLPPAPEPALAALEADDVLVDALGEEFVEVYCAVKRAELQAFYRVTTDWERDQYTETL